MTARAPLPTDETATAEPPVPRADDEQEPRATRADDEQEPRAAVRWTSYTLVLAILVGGGVLLAWPGLRPAIIPRWLWWGITAGHGEGCFAIAVVLASGMAADAVDLLLIRGHRRLARALVVTGVVALAALSAWAFREEHRLTALLAALMATVGSLARRLFPGLPGARARIRH